jgi:hypothetical protein
MSCQDDRSDSLKPWNKEREERNKVWVYIEHAVLIKNFNMVNLLIRYGCDLYQGYLNNDELDLWIQGHRHLSLYRI